MLPIKRGWCSADRLVNEQLYGLDLEPYAGGAFVVVYLSPYGYHGVHMPTDGRLLEARWLPGRFFPQNDGALVALPDVYARNERVVLRCLEQYGREYLLVLVAASLVGGIHLCGLDRREWARPRALALDWPVAKGARIGHFGFGSTVVVLLPRGAGRPAVRPGHDVLMGHTVVQRMPLLAEAPVQ
jgi:phosphatidylserine decarboxylase